MPDLYFLIFGIVIGLIGIIIVILKIRVFTACRIRVNATISSIQTESTLIRGSTLHTFRPKLSYTVNGKTYRTACPFSTVREKKYSVGDTMSIFVSPSVPDLIRYPGRVGLFITGIILFGIGLLYVILYFL